MQYKYVKFLFLILFIMGSKGLPAQAKSNIENIMPLNGNWEFKLDEKDEGISGQWFNKKFDDIIKLPGSTDENGFGNPQKQKEIGRLTRKVEYVGPAWYRRSVTISKEWKGKHIIFSLERCHWESRVWVDNKYAGMCNSLSTSHVYDLSKLLTTGNHTITVMVDNRLKINVCHTYGSWRWANSVTDETQTNWNGIIGKIELKASDPVWIESVQAYPNTNLKTVDLKIDIGNNTKSDANIELNTLLGNSSNSSFKVKAARGLTEHHLTIKYDDLKNWDEFTACMQELKISLTGKNGKSNFQDNYNLSIGLRTISKDQHYVFINRKKLYLRGTGENAIWPKTGHPSMNVDDWKRVIQINKDLGLNFFRFHSWCPPEAAFKAADELGFYFQVEGPIWDGYGNIGGDTVRAKWLRKEVARIVDEYGNHPSFLLMSMGNELGDAKEKYLQNLVEMLRKKDPRHYYTCSTHPMDMARNDDYFDAASTPKGTIRGEEQPDNDINYEANAKIVDRPIIVHEAGQYCMFPDFKEIEKYTGPVKAYNLEAYRESMEKNGLLSQAEDFHFATGEKTLLMYKWQIEALLRTKSIAGFELLGIQDFTGQGSAYIGILDPFWESKGIIKPEEFKQFSGAVVPLAGFKKMVWNSSETFCASAEVFNYGADDIKNPVFHWSIITTGGKVLKNEIFPMSKDIPTGGLTEFGNITCSLASITAPTELIITFNLIGTAFSNEWKIWVYPDTNKVQHDNIVIVNKWDENTKKLLQDGKRVFLIPEGFLKNQVESRWSQVFWNLLLFPHQASTMGILCNPDHPAFSEFPTASYADWQWYDILQKSEALQLKNLPEGFLPIVQFIDDYHPNYNRFLSGIFEANVDKGRLVVSTIDLENNLNERPAALQLRNSLLDYMASDKFLPKFKIEENVLDSLLTVIPVKETLDNTGKLLSEAVLYVKAGGNVTETKKTSDWASSKDNVVKAKNGFSYQLENVIVQKDEHGSAWISNESPWENIGMKIKIKYPVEFKGHLLVHFQDWGNQNRNAQMFFDGRDNSIVGPHKDGKWVSFNLINPDEAVLKLQLLSGPNILITEIALIPE